MNIINKNEIEEFMNVSPYFTKLIQFLGLNLEANFIEINEVMDYTQIAKHVLIIEPFPSFRIRDRIFRRGGLRNRMKKIYPKLIEYGKKLNIDIIDQHSKQIIRRKLDV